MADRPPADSWLYEVADLVTAHAVLQQFAAFPPVGRVAFSLHRIDEHGRERWFVGASGEALTPADRTLIPRVLGRRGRRADSSLAARVQSQGRLVSTIRTRGMTGPTR